MDDDVEYDDDPWRVYLREVQRVPPLGRVEEVDCIEHVRAGGPMAESARTRLVEANLHLVVSIAERYRNHHVHILDLIAKGNEGLMRAVREVGDSGHDQFLAHMTTHIQSAIEEAIANPGSHLLPI